MATSRTRQRLDTRASILREARQMFGAMTYEAVTLRALAVRLGRTTGAICDHFHDKAELWRAAMGSEPPTDSPMTRAAPRLHSALAQLLAVHDQSGNEEQLRAAWSSARDAVAEVGLSDPSPPEKALATDLHRLALDIEAAALSADLSPNLPAICDQLEALGTGLVEHSQGRIGGSQVYAKAVALAAAGAVVALRGCAGFSYRYDLDFQALHDRKTSDGKR